MNSSENSHNGQSTNGSLKLPVGWFERIVLSCDFFAVHCGEGVTGVKLHCASCKRLKMYQLYHRSLWAWLQLIFYRISLGFDFLYVSFVRKKNQLQLIIQFSSVYFVTVWSWNLHVKKTNKKPPNTINNNNNKSFFSTSAHVTQIFRHLTAQSSDCIKALMLKTKIVLWCSALCKPRAEHLRGITVMREQLYFNYSLSNCCAMLTTAAAW